MAEVRLIRLTWENGVNFKMDTKLGDGSYITIMEMEENGCIAKLWPDAQNLCEKFFGKCITDIGTVMSG